MVSFLVRSSKFGVLNPEPRTPNQEPLPHMPSPIYADGLAGHEPGLEEEHGRWRSPSRRPIGPAALRPRPPSSSSSRRVRRREDGAWRDRVDQNLVGGELQRERFGEADDARLGDVIWKVAGIAGPAAGGNPVAEVDDAPAAGLRMCGMAARAQRYAARDRPPALRPSGLVDPSNGPADRSRPC